MPWNASHAQREEEIGHRSKLDRGHENRRKEHHGCERLHLLVPQRLRHAEERRRSALSLDLEADDRKRVRDHEQDRSRKRTGEGLVEIVVSRAIEHGITAPAAADTADVQRCYALQKVALATGDEGIVHEIKGGRRCAGLNSGLTASGAPGSRRRRYGAMCAAVSSPSAASAK